MATLVDGPALARSIGRPEQTLRAWASLGLIQRHGKDRRGRTLFDVDEVLAVAEQHPPRRRAPRRAEEEAYSPRASAVRTIYSE